MIGGIPHTLATQGWWIVSRSSGLVAFVLVTISVFLGLTMAGKPVRQPGFARTMKALHEQTAIAALVAIGIPIACLFVYRLGAARRSDERRRRAPRPGRSLPDTA